MKELLRDNIRDLVPYSCARDEFTGEAEVYLDANENFFDYLGDGYNRYPDPLCRDLRVEIEKKMNLPFKNTVIGNGSDELIDNLIRIFCEPKKESILIMPPTYGAYKVFADVNDVACRELPLNKDFSIDIDGFNNFSKLNSDSTDRCKIAFVCSPNNPTGEAQSNEVISELASSFSGILVVDEAYGEFSDKESAVDLIDKYPNIVVLKTFSKCWGLAGARLGIMVADEYICEVMNKVKAPYNVGIPAQKAGLEQLSKSKDILIERDDVIKRRNEYFEKFKKLDIVEKVYDSDANFLLMKTKNSDQICKELQKKGIIIRNRNKDLHCRNCVRITIGSEEECKRVFDSMSEINL